MLEFILSFKKGEKNYMELIGYEDKKIVDEFFLNDEQKLERVVLTKHKTSSRDAYQLYCYLVDYDGNETLQGYMYFNVCPTKDGSNYIGTYVNPKYRNRGIANYLNSVWIKYCLENGLECLKTIKRQRKPYILYMLKGYTFEINNKDLYDNRSIHICRDREGSKFLLFDNEEEKRRFMSSTICLDGNYRVLDSLEDGEELDRVILNHKYTLEDNDKAYNLASSIRNNRRKKR